MRNVDTITLEAIFNTVTRRSAGQTVHAFNTEKAVVINATNLEKAKLDTLVTFIELLSSTTGCSVQKEGEEHNLKLKLTAPDKQNAADLNDRIFDLSAKLNGQPSKGLDMQLGLVSKYPDLVQPHFEFNEDNHLMIGVKVQYPDRISVPVEFNEFSLKKKALRVDDTQVIAIGTMAMHYVTGILHDQVDLKPEAITYDQPEPTPNYPAFDQVEAAGLHTSRSARRAARTPVQVG